MPNLSAFGGSTVGDGYSVHWHVPIDDTHHWKYLFMFSKTKPLAPELRDKNRAELMPDYRLTRDGANRYQQDRESMKTKSFTGIGFNFQAHDVFATESQGPVQNRTNEHLVSSDKAIVAARKLLLNAIKDVKEGTPAAACDQRSESEPLPASGRAFRARARLNGFETICQGPGGKISIEFKSSKVQMFKSSI